jgi:CheY-like chemotaxis protein
MVLMVDDDPDDREMLRKALTEINVEHQFIEADDGVEAMKKLEELLKKGQLPCLIVLDINMPKMDGRQTFVAIKNNNELSKIPIVIFSTSDSVLDTTFFSKT